MKISEELIAAMAEHHISSGNKVRTLRIHENLWEQLSKEMENSLVETKVPGEAMSFNEADVIFVKSSEDPMGFFRWSMM